MNNLNDTFGLDVVLDVGGLTTGASATDLKFASAMRYVIDGKWYNKASGTFPLTAIATAVLGTAEAMVVGLWLNATATGTVNVNHGEIISTNDLTNGTIILDLPPLRSGEALAGLARISTNSATTFTPGTTAPTAVTVAFTDTMHMPTRGFTAAS